MWDPTLKAWVQRRLPRDEWQAAIDEAGFLVPLVLDRAQPDEALGRWHGALGDRAVVFRLDCEAAAALNGFAQPGHLLTVSAGGAVFPDAAPGFTGLWAWLRRAGGSFVTDDLEPYAAPDFPKVIDSMLAISFDRMGGYLARYPEDARSPDGETVARPTLAPASRP